MVTPSSLTLLYSDLVKQWQFLHNHFCCFDHLLSEQNISVLSHMTPNRLTGADAYRIIKISCQGSHHKQKSARHHVKAGLYFCVESTQNLGGSLRTLTFTEITSTQKREMSSKEMVCTTTDCASPATERHGWANLSRAVAVCFAGTYSYISREKHVKPQRRVCSYAVPTASSLCVSVNRVTKNKNKYIKLLERFFD